MVEAIHPCIGLVDDSPSRWSQLHTGEVEGGDIISVVLKAAVDASEETLCSPICFADKPTSWACYGGVFRLNVDDWDSPFKGFVFDKRLQFPISPTMEVSILVFPMLSSVANPSQLLHNDYVALSEAVHESPADLMEDGVNVSPLPSAQPFQSAFSRLRAFSLKGGAELPKTVPFTEDFSTFNFEAVGSYKEVLHPNINAHRIVTFRLWDGFVDCNVEKKLLISVNQNCMGRFSIFEKFPLIFAYVERNFHSLLYSGDGGIDSVRLIYKPEEPLIQIHGKTFEFERFVPSLLVGFSNPISGSYSEVCWKLKFLPSLPVNHMVEGNWIKNPSLKSYLRNVVAGISKSLKCLKQLLQIFNCWLKLAYSRLRELHQKAYMQFRYLNFKTSIPPTTEVRGLRWMKVA